jgi:hypothetical protein
LEICKALGAANCTLVGAEWVTDQRVEDAYYKWLQGGASRDMLVIIEYDTGSGKEVVRIEPEEVPELV